MGWLSKVFKPVTDVLGQLTGTKAAQQAAQSQADMIQQQTTAQVQQAREQASMMQQSQEQLIANQRAADAARTLEQQAAVVAAPDVTVGVQEADPQRRRNPRASFMSGRSQGSGIQL